MWSFRKTVRHCHPEASWGEQAWRVYNERSEHFRMKSIWEAHVLRHSIPASELSPHSEKTS